MLVQDSEERLFLQQYFVIPQESRATKLNRRLKFIRDSYGMTKVGLNIANKK